MWYNLQYKEKKDDSMSLLEKYEAMNSTDSKVALKEEVKGILRDYRNFWDI